MKIRSPLAVLYRHFSTPHHPLFKPLDFLPRAIALGAALVLMGAMAGTVQPAAAQQGFGNFFGYQNPPKRAVRKKRPPAAPAQAGSAAAASKATAAKAEKAGPKGALTAIVSLPDQHINVYDATGRIAHSRVSTGVAGHRTPSGVFSVIGKSRHHRSNIYSGAPMPWMQRITWSGIALHAGVVPGYPASHGCIRLPYSFAPQLYGLTKIGARVIVTTRDVTPVDFSHALLPLPKMQPAPAPQQEAAGETAVKLASADAATASDTTAAAAGHGDEASAPKLLDPISYAGALRQRALADKSAADAMAKSALDAAQAAGAEARQAAEAVETAETELKAAETKLDDVTARAAGASDQADAGAATPDTTASIASEKSTAEAAVEQARGALSAAREHEAEKSKAAFAAVEAWKRAAETAEAADDLIAEATRRRQQVSVFVSKKEGRIFIRQDWKEVWDAPVTIRDPERPLGTHVYTAVDVAPDGSNVHWTAITMPPEGAAAPRRGKSKGKDAASDEAAQSSAAPETAAGALDRIELPEEARERIAELLWTGGSLIVSDHPRSYEMGEYTDFIVLTR